MLKRNSVLVSLVSFFLLASSSNAEQLGKNEENNYFLQLNYSMFQNASSSWSDTGTTPDDYVQIDASKLDGYTSFTFELGTTPYPAWEISIRQMFEADTYWNTGRVVQRDGTSEVRIKALTKIEDTSIKLARKFSIDEGWSVYPFISVGQADVTIKAYEFTHISLPVPISNTEKNTSKHIGVGISKEISKQLELSLEFENSNFGDARLLEFNGTKTVSYEIKQNRSSLGLRFKF